jgi:hypothetical protein
MKDLKNHFKDWLIKQGLSQTTPSGKHSTVYYYVGLIDKICDTKGYDDWNELASNTFNILHTDKTLTAKNRTVLTKFNEFLYEIEYLRILIPNNAFRISPDTDYVEVLTTIREPTAATPRIVGDDKDANRVLFPPKEVYDILHLSNTRCLRRWAEWGKGPKPIKDSSGRVWYHRDELNKFIARQFPKKIY